MKQVVNECGSCTGKCKWRHKARVAMVALLYVDWSVGGERKANPERSEGRRVSERKRKREKHTQQVELKSGWYECNRRNRRCSGLLLLVAGQRANGHCPLALSLSLSMCPNGCTLYLCTGRSFSPLPLSLSILIPIAPSSPPCTIHLQRCRAYLFLSRSLRLPRVYFVPPGLTLNQWTILGPPDLPPFSLPLCKW